MQCKYCYRTGTLPVKVRVVGSIPLSGTGSFLLPLFSSTSLSLLTYNDCAAHLPRCMRVCGGPAYLSGGPSYHIDFDHKHSSGRILGLR